MGKGSSDVKTLLTVCYGGGTNSTAVLCGFRDRNIRPDLVLFADTGSEMPHTYEYVAMMGVKIKEWFGIELETVRTLYQGKFEGLEGECIRGSKLPALAYGSRACSQKYKQAPQNRRIKEELNKRDLTVTTKVIGFDAGEAHRVRKSPDVWAINWYPLVDWEWWREECVEAIQRHGLPQPGKSACFFCPAMKRHEVFNLRDKHPDLLKRALAMEDAAQATVTTPRGLGGGGANRLWRNWLAMDELQSKLFDLQPSEMPCGCIDE